MSTQLHGPFSSPRNHGTVIAISTAAAPIPIHEPLHRIATFITAGTGLRVGVIHTTPQRGGVKPYQPAESLLAACNGAAGRLIGVKPARRIVDQPPGVDWFAPRLTNTLKAQDWLDIYQEARLSRGVLLVVDPVESIYRDITLTFDTCLRIEECGRKLDYPDDPNDWKSIAVTILNTMLAVRALFVPPCDAFGMEAIFGSPLG